MMGIGGTESTKSANPDVATMENRSEPVQRVCSLQNDNQEFGHNNCVHVPEIL